MAGCAGAGAAPAGAGGGGLTGALLSDADGLTGALTGGCEIGDGCGWAVGYADGTGRGAGEGTSKTHHAATTPAATINRPNNARIHPLRVPPPASGSGRTEGGSPRTSARLAWRFSRSLRTWLIRLTSATTRRRRWWRRARALPPSTTTRARPVGRGRVLGGEAHVALSHLVFALRVNQQQRLVGDHVHQPRHATRGPVKLRHGARP